MTTAVFVVGIGLGLCLGLAVLRLPMPRPVRLALRVIAAAVLAFFVWLWSTGRTWALAGLALVLVACGSPTVKVQRAEFAITYADMKSQITVWMFRVRQGCEQKKLTPATCADLDKVETGLHLLDEQAKAMLRQADREPDWAMIGKYAEIAIGLVAKAAL